MSNEKGKPDPTPILREDAELALVAMQDAVNAFTWYAEELVQEIHGARKDDFKVSEVHIVLLYQQVDALNRAARTARETIGLHKGQ